MELEILGRPQGKGRPRLSKHGTYTPQKTKDYEELVKLVFVNKYNVNTRPTDKPLKAKIRAYFKIPTSISKPQKNKLKNQPYPHKPDADNIAKIILDSLNGLAFVDDNQVVFLEVEKWYTESEEKVILEIEEV
jgi:Holliday junction resolvase RusA-like endonuclease